MAQLIELYVQALKDHRVDYWNDIREAIYREVLKGSYEYLRQGSLPRTR